MNSGQPDPGITFESPPVFEVALSVQFDDVPLTAAHYGLFWSGLRDRYPTPIEQPPLDPVIEQLAGIQIDKGPQFKVLDKPDTPRMWFVSLDGTELVQLQRDRFVRNWRLHVPGATYPRYPALRQRFAQDFARFVEFVEREGLGDVTPTQVEVTYINHVPAVDGEQHTQPGRHFNIGQLPEVFPGDEFEDVRVIGRWIMRHEGRRVGRLHADLRPAYVSKSQAPIWNLNLVARGAPLPSTSVMEGVLEFMDAGRSRIVAAFDALTSKEMHVQWNRR